MVGLIFVVACLLRGIKSMPFWLFHQESISTLQKGMSVSVDESNYVPGIV